MSNRFLLRRFLQIFAQVNLVGAWRVIIYLPNRQWPRASGPRRSLPRSLGENRQPMSVTVASGGSRRQEGRLIEHSRRLDGTIVVWGADRVTFEDTDP